MCVDCMHVSCAENFVCEDCTLAVTVVCAGPAELAVELGLLQLTFHHFLPCLQGKAPPPGQKGIGAFFGKK